MPLKVGKLTAHTALLTDADGECHVECVVEPGLADEPVDAFLDRFLRRS